VDGEVRATVLIPTFDHGPTLRYSIPSALQQTVENIEIFVVGDGVPDVTREIIEVFERQDERVRFFDNPKGPRHGEIHRHAALREARGEIVCYLSDDDLWLPEHVEYMLALLQGADFAHACPARMERAGGVFVYPGELALPFYRRSMLSGVNFIPLSHAAHTLDMYRRLPYGWRTTPPGTPTDLYMWQQFISDSSCRAVSGSRPTAVNFPRWLHPEVSVEERLAELELWAERMASKDWRQWYEDAVLDFLARDRAVLWESKEELQQGKAELARVYASTTWRLHVRLLGMPGVGRLIRWAADRRSGRHASAR
jgi:glycosyltransferase involved in cell wall biosynthesis